MKTNIIRIFVSSTFSDFKQEREILNQKVAPKLDAYCRARGFRFQLVDLRWGISDKAGEEQETIHVCLDEIRRCQDISPEPNLFIMLGNRYGWQPLPPSIPQNEFAAICAAFADCGDCWRGHPVDALFCDFYQLDQNAVPPVMLLKPCTADPLCAPKSRFLPYALREIMPMVVLADEKKEKYLMSATGLEILHSAL